MYGVVTEAVGARDTAGDLLARLAVSGAALLVGTLDGIESGQLRAVPQPDEGISFAPRSLRTTRTSTGACPPWPSTG